jgi:hypothetical protein
VLSKNWRRRGRGSLPAEREDLLQLGLDARGELKGIEAVAPVLQLRQLHRIGGSRSYQALQRRLWRFLMPP